MLLSKKTKKKMAVPKVPFIIRTHSLRRCISTYLLRKPYTVAASVPLVMMSLLSVSMAAHTKRSKVKPKLTEERLERICPPKKTTTVVQLQSRDNTLPYTHALNRVPVYRIAVFIGRF